MKIGLLSRKSTPDEILAAGDYISREDLKSVKAVSTSLAELGQSVRLINPDDLLHLIESKVDLIFNLCDDGFNGKSQYEPNLPALLDLLGVPYTGSNYLALGVCLNKPMTKEILSYHGLRTPKFQVFFNGDERVSGNFKFPLIVKPSSEDASIGIRDDSVVHDKVKLRSKINDVISTFKQPALVEEYISGREFNVGILGNSKLDILPLSEIIFTMPKGLNHICSYEAKWISDNPAYFCTKPECPARTSKKLRRELTEMAVKAYQVMGCRDYGRVDFRVDKNGRPYILEVNPNPDISQEAGLANMASKAGLSYTQLVERIVEYAIERNLKQ